MQYLLVYQMSVIAMVFTMNYYQAAFTNDLATPVRKFLKDFYG